LKDGHEFKILQLLQIKLNLIYNNIKNSFTGVFLYCFGVVSFAIFSATVSILTQHISHVSDDNLLVKTHPAATMAFTIS